MNGKFDVEPIQQGRFYEIDGVGGMIHPKTNVLSLTAAEARELAEKIFAAMEEWSEDDLT